MIRVKAAAGDLFDIYWAQAYSLNSTLPKGVATDLAPYFRQPNPYIPGNKAWQDAMDKAQLAESRSASGAVYTLSGDKVVYGIYYNKNLFKKAGITKVPTSWTELIAASKKLNAVGVYPMHAVPAYPWWSRHFLSDLYAAYAGQSGTRCWSYPASRNGVIRHPPSQRTSCPHYERLTVSGVNFLLFFLRLSPRSSIR